MKLSEVILPTIPSFQSICHAKYYNSFVYFIFIFKSQDWAACNFKALKQKINEQIQKQLEFQERMEKKIDEILQYQLELRKLSQNIPQCTIPQDIVNDYLPNEPIAQK